MPQIGEKSGTMAIFYFGNLRGTDFSNPGSEAPENFAIAPAKSANHSVESEDFTVQLVAQSAEATNFPVESTVSLTKFAADSVE